jgi:hypothetical protein
MSLHFDMVINCDLREDTPDAVIEIVRCLTQRDYRLAFTPQMDVQGHGNVWDRFYDYHFLAPQPERDVISNFRRVHRLTIPNENNREVYQFRLQYCASWIHDDFWAHHHIPFVYWLASHACEGFIGYYVETNAFSSNVNLLVVQDRRLKEPNS